MSTSPNSASLAAAQASDRSRLTEAEKKQNHILSEQKRRQAIRAGFDRLATLVPGMEGQGRSEAVVLDATVKELKKERARKEKLMQKAIASGRFTAESFEAAYAEARATIAQTSQFPQPAQFTQPLQPTQLVQHTQATTHPADDEDDDLDDGDVHGMDDHDEDDDNNKTGTVGESQLSHVKEEH